MRLDRLTPVFRWVKCKIRIGSIENKMLVSDVWEIVFTWVPFCRLSPVLFLCWRGRHKHTHTQTDTQTHTPNNGQILSQQQ